MTALGFGPLELWVGNARHAAAFFVSRFGFSVVARGGPSTGLRDRMSYALQQGDITLIVTGAATPDSEVGSFVRAHGDGVRDIALITEGAVSNDPVVIPAFGDVVHTLVDPAAPRGSWSDSLEVVDPVLSSGRPVGLIGVDHCAVSVEPGERESCLRHYEHALGMARESPDQLIEVDDSAFVMSTLRMPGGGAFVFAEPAPAPRKSQITDFLEHFGGAGVHHLALATRDIAHTMACLRERGITALPVPASYRENLEARCAVLERELTSDLPSLAELGVMADADADGFLLQAFTEPLGDRPTTYLEIIQREGTRGFGAQNVRDLYSSVLHEQERRGSPV